VKNTDETRNVGQFIPLHYHFHMLNAEERMNAFRTAIELIVQPGDTVLELGGGTGVLSFFAAQKAARVFCVEYNLDLVDAARELLKQNPNGDKVEVIHADGFEYMPPQPVHVVVCEMLHVGLLREKQLEMIDSFKTRYSKAFPQSPMPIFIPGATFQAIQPVQQDFNFSGYYAPVVQIQDAYGSWPKTEALGNPVIYQQIMYDQPYSLECKWNGVLQIDTPGKFNALRVITKSILAVMPETKALVDWHNHYMIHPLGSEIAVEQGQTFEVGIDYMSGAPLTAFKPEVRPC